MTFIHNFFTSFSSPSQTGEPVGLQAVVGLIALGILVWGVRGLIQWKIIDARRKGRYILLVVLSSIIFIVSLLRVYHDTGEKIASRGQNRPLAGSSLGYSIEHGTSSAGWNLPISTNAK